ncbi:hypothetical protein HK103_001881 [Boothiomyces macroporosus]|uniref:CBM1 domain-containing protein n=1 Tax=Boothiomyces macroporosus TaxID=261099 RepID=A0AAD5Y0B6_9FUNG|nr:hypothetical protein HK103_001881 [Boothiomyces macroporosus]
MPDRWGRPSSSLDQQFVHHSGVNVTSINLGGGVTWTGPTCCASGSFCSAGNPVNPWYSQCIPGTAPATTSDAGNGNPTTTTTSTVPTSGSCVGAPLAPYSQCGGFGYVGSNCCASFSGVTYACQGGYWWMSCTPSGNQPPATTTTNIVVPVTTTTNVVVPATTTTRAATTTNPVVPTTTANVPSTTTSNSATPTGCVGAPLAEWAQCSGIGYTGSTCCSSGLVCVVSSQWWGSCQKAPPTTAASTTVSASTTKVTSTTTPASATTTKVTTSSASPTSTHFPMHPPPARVFAPYLDVTKSTISVSDMQNARTNWVILSFIVAGSNNQPTWASQYDITSSFYMDAINSIRANGNDIAIAFGGYDFQELALVITDVKQLQAAYQSVIDRYQVSWIDFDIESTSIYDTAANDRRAQAIAGLQQANPGLTVSFTVSVIPSGMVSSGISWITNLKSRGVRIDILNILAMDYGVPGENGATGMGGYAIQAAQSTYAQLQQIGYTSTKLGITPMIGANDVSGEFFTLANAQQVVDFALANSYIQMLAFWSLHRDSACSGQCADYTNYAAVVPLYDSSRIAQNAFDFSHIFNAF